MTALERLAVKSDIEKLTLYTASAAGLYEKAGWRTIETFKKKGKDFQIMRKELGRG